MGPQEGGPPQGMADGGYLLPEDTGIAQLPARNLENMAGGGLVSFAYGGDIPRYAGDEGSDINEEEEPEEPRPRLDSRGDYRAEMDKIRADQEKQDRDYKTGREGLGEAYANAEERDKEMTQRYSDEERSVKGQALMNFGLNLMQSRERGLAGIGAAGLAALPQYISGRKELSSLKDKQRDYMQTVAEARRGEKLGLLKDMYNVSAAGTGQRIAQAGVEAQLGESTADRASREAVANARAAGRGSNIKVQEEYNRRAMMFRDAADDPENASRREALLAEAEKFQNLADTMAAQSSGVPYKIDAARQKALGDKGNAVRYALKLRRDPKTKAQGDELLQSVSGETGVPVPELIQRFSGSGSTDSGASGGGGSNDPVGLR
jgi:hypothetical protein